MKASFNVHDFIDTLINENPILYFSKGYLKSQEYKHFLCIENGHFFLPLSINEQLAISLPRSPFGSFYVKNEFSSFDFEQFIDEVKNVLKKKGVSSLRISHPSAIYPNFVDNELLKSNGFEEVFSDINQHIDLDSKWENKIHKMQQRKLASLAQDGFVFKTIDINELEMAHKFIKVCRMTQELDINISYSKLKELSDLTQAYDIFGVFRGEKISALCIAVKVTNNIAYYYLPATSPMFRNQSPMVLLIKGMIEHYHALGFKFLDMGLSSVEGTPQETLRIFKERMGANELEKSTFTLRI